jgi:ATP-dependent Lon protease
MEMEIITAPIVVLNNLSVFPGITTLLEINRKQSIESVQYAGQNHRMLVFVMPLEEYKEEIQDPDSPVQSLMKLHSMGVMAKLSYSQKTGNGTLRISVEGVGRVELLALQDFMVTVQSAPMQITFDHTVCTPEEQEAMEELLEEKFLACVNAFPKQSGMSSVKNLLNQQVPLGVKMNAIMAKLPFKAEKRYRYLETTQMEERLYLLMQMLDEETQSLTLRDSINRKVREHIDQNQREYVLREQMRTIQDELGDGMTEQNRELEERLKELDAPQEVSARITKELGRLKTMPFGSQESVVLRGFVETLLDMPWNKKTTEDTDIAHAKEILEEDHYGLDKVKERVLEYLAVRNLNGGHESTILCLVGPPGTGKTSIAKSIARALNRKYVRISLGGVHDEAEIRGHRKTYVGAMPGRIANAIKQAGVSNPLIVLDELDKLGADHRGDPASALLEVLDSEQNVTFRDHFLELPIDLSEVIFVATANDAGTIPGPLRDRVEMIQVDSYTANEKLHIAEKYLVEKQKEKHGLSGNQLTITQDALYALIHSYTKEAGVRELERKIGALCRKTARVILEEHAEGVTIEAKDLEHFLGKALYKEENVTHEDQVGIVRGLAWTSVGGDTLEVEVNVMPGKGVLQLTGKLGDVMKESAQTALTYVRSISEDYAVDDEYFDKHDIHLHVPEGAVPKDGPSAGVTIATAMFSAVTGKPVRGDVAMTGEVTLRGRVLPIGGLKEKLLAAGDAGMKRVLVPAANEPDVAELSTEITEPLDIRFVKNMNEVLEGALA